MLPSGLPVRRRRSSSYRGKPCGPLTDPLRIHESALHVNASHHCHDSSAARGGDAGAQEPGSEPCAEPPSSRSARPHADEPGRIVITAAEHNGLDAHWLHAMTTRAADHLRCDVDRVCVMLVGDEQMTRLHHVHMELAETTDVLTFPHHVAGEPVDVDIAVCVDEAARQAARRGHSVSAEVMLYVVHGLLHCTDHDDHDETDAQRMHAEEDRILTALGIGAIFADQPQGAEPS